MLNWLLDSQRLRIRVSKVGSGTAHSSGSLGIKYSTRQINGLLRDSFGRENDVRSYNIQQSCDMERRRGVAESNAKASMVAYREQNCCAHDTGWKFTAKRWLPSCQIMIALPSRPKRGKKPRNSIIEWYFYHSFVTFMAPLRIGLCGPPKRPAWSVLLPQPHSILGTYEWGHSTRWCVSNHLCWRWPEDYLPTGRYSRVIHILNLAVILRGRPGKNW